jgi:ABC-type transporter Mla subunit MlaD
MSKKLLLATILILLVGATLFGLGLSSVTEKEQKTEVIAQQSRVSELKFTLPAITLVL